MNATTITPAAIDDYVPIDSIRIVDRHRRDLGDLDALGKSILDVGLLNPVTLTCDDRLVAGQRRMQACRLIGMDTVPVRYVDNLTDAAALLRAERDENVCRKDMSASELYAVGKALEGLERPAAAQRQADAGARNLGIASSDPGIGTSDYHDTREAVGAAIGLSGPQWQRLKHMGDRAAEGDQPASNTLQRIDSGEETIAGGYRKLRKTDTEPTAQPATEPDPTPEQDWIPEGSDRSRKAVERRRHLIREMAPRGYTSGQMAELLGIGRDRLKDVAKEEGVEIVADKVIGRSRHRVDSNRVIRTILTDLENTEMSLRLVNFSELEVSQIEHWTTSLSKSIRMLNRLNKQLKDVAQ